MEARAVNRGRGGRRRGWGWALLLVAAVAAGAAEPAPRGARTIVLANADDPDSRRIARHYAAARGVPEANVVALPLAMTETISWPEFVTTLWQPLLERLVRDKWIDAIPMALTDVIGRTKYAPYGHRMEALVVCRGVPLKIAHDPALFGEVRPLTSRAEFRTNAGAVDAELSLLPTPNYAISAFMPNPLFQLYPLREDATRQVVAVGRLDGATVEDALGLVDRAAAAERTGLLGRAYVDLSGRDPVGEEWLESAARQLTDLHFDTTVDRAPATFPAEARFDAPVLYFGWYAGDLTGPFALPGFRFPPGAIALHIHSYSAATLRTTTAGWTAPLVARGATGTFGNVNEPYLQFTHRPHLLVRALARGATLGEAAMYALNALSWQAVLVGDPLYRPFPSPSARPQPEPEKPVSDRAGYAVLRRMRELDAAKRGDEARALAVRSLREAPHLAVGVELAARLLAAGETEAAASALGAAAVRTDHPADEWGLVAEAARLLVECRRPARAVELWRTLFALPTLPGTLRWVWLPAAEEAAKAAQDFPQAARWAAERAENGKN